MTSPIAAMKGLVLAWRARDAANWVGLAASPTFALMAGIAAADTPAAMVCSAASGVLPIDGMAWMYLLMSLFHLPPWLKLVSAWRDRSTLPNPN